MSSFVRFALLGLLLLAVPGLAFFKHYRHHLNLPEGCDEFGYLQLADAISHNRTFDDHTERPYAPELIRALEEAGFEHRAYAWMLAPHCYHVDRETRQIINQYPPGTSLLVSVFKKVDRQVAFVWVVTLLAVALPLVALHRLDVRQEARLDSGAYYLLAFLVISLIVNPFMVEYERIGSLSPTFGLLLAAGILLQKRPGAALLLIGASTLFRIPNVVLAAPVLLYFTLHREGTEVKWRRYPARALTGAVLFLLGGFVLYLAYVYLLLGSPLAITYSEIDRAMASGSEIRAHLTSYLDLDQPWLRVHLLALVVPVLWTVKGRFSLGFLSFLFLTVLVNYSFYFFHRVRIDYYPYASALLLLGVSIGALASLEVRRSAHRALIPVGGALLVVMTVAAVARRDVDHRASFQAQVELYERCFAEADVVWADRRSGTVEYATGTPAHRYGWGSEAATDVALSWLRQRGLRQLVWVDDLALEPDSLAVRLTALGMLPRDERCGELGRIIVVDPASGADDPGDGSAVGPRR